MTNSRAFCGWLMILSTISAGIFIVCPLPALGNNVAGTPPKQVSRSSVSRRVAVSVFPSYDPAPPTPEQNSTSGKPEYNYIVGSPAGPDNWGNLSPDWYLCNDGKEQSPVGIDIAEARKSNHALGNLNYTYPTSTALIVNVGQGIDVNFGEGAGSFELGDEIYNLEGLHLHAPSEHTINNVRFPLEMHLVHRTPDGKKLAVIGVVFWKSCTGPFFDQFEDLLPKLAAPNANVTAAVSFEKLHIGPNYARYRGSLTTPPCTEDVTWTVELSQINTISQSQLDAMLADVPEENARPLQQNVNPVSTYCDC